ncbi:hypothetical protein JS756_21295 [Streptomyces actuosus]|uniref:Uncharacterized protein n=1 Tax=Streptomyces actuosus TaxID=1885 RepID=A0ABS2VU89_STRAS|nr:hypothetical protein [Streptomyces actuosus]MBN0046594.1 hypothetical protein [Streptomyces actuosus]
MSQSTEPRAAEPAIASADQGVRDRSAFDDTRDLEDARRGFMGTARQSVIPDADGRTVWDLDACGFLDRDCPDTANPSLWRLNPWPGRSPRRR